MFVVAGGTLLLSQIGRDQGKRKENELFDMFGGRPSERFLSHEGAVNKTLLAQRHTKLRTLLPDVRIPTADEERRAPAQAHETYSACVDFLISRTRADQLLFQENVNDGFRRNLWGLKPLGIIVSLGSSMALGSRLYLDFTTHSAIAPLIVSFEALNVLMVATWVWWITPRWVMLPSRAYADRLLEALDRM
jgi:hypothetical protein